MKPEPVDFDEIQAGIWRRTGKFWAWSI